MKTIWRRGDCAYEPDGRETCAPNLPTQGINLDRYLEGWQPGSSKRAALKKVHLALAVEMPGGRETRMSLRSRVVRTTDELYREYAWRVTADMCEQMGS